MLLQSQQDATRRSSCPGSVRQPWATAAAANWSSSKWRPPTRLWRLRLTYAILILIFGVASWWEILPTVILSSVPFFPKYSSTLQSTSSSSSSWSSFFSPFFEALSQYVPCTGVWGVWLECDEMIFFILWSRASHNSPPPLPHLPTSPCCCLPPVCQDCPPSPPLGRRRDPDTYMTVPPARVTLTHKHGPAKHFHYSLRHSGQRQLAMLTTPISDFNWFQFH